MTEMPTSMSFADTWLPIDWRPDIERLRSEADLAAREGRDDPYTEVEAECWLDLVEAEIAAQASRNQSHPEVIAATKQLQEWRAELLAILRRLRERRLAEKIHRPALDDQKHRNQITFRRPPEVGLAPSRG